MYREFISSSYVVRFSFFINFLKTVLNIIFIHAKIDVSEALSLVLSLPAIF